MLISFFHFTSKSIFGLWNRVELDTTEIISDDFFKINAAHTNSRLREERACRGLLLKSKEPLQQGVHIAGVIFICVYRKNSSNKSIYFNKVCKPVKSSHIEQTLVCSWFLHAASANLNFQGVCILPNMQIIVMGRRGLMMIVIWQLSFF